MLAGDEDDKWDSVSEVISLVEKDNSLTPAQACTHTFDVVIVL